eukprot:COSAG02_NODE_4927_length_4825_cov_9.987093_4_plen_63_part_00
MTGCIGILYSDSEFMDLTPSLILVPPVIRIRKNADFATKFRPMTRIHHKSDILLKIPNNDQH